MSRHPQIRTRRPNLGIHDPQDPSPRVLPPEAQEQWQRAYDEAMRTYNDAGIASSAAWRTVRLSWQDTSGDVWEACEGGSCVTWPSPEMLPQPQTDLVGLGVLIEYGYIDRKGALQIRKTDPDLPPILWWDDALKILYAFPGIPYPTCSLSNRRANLAGPGEQIYKKWTHRESTCADTMRIPAVRIQCFGAADTVSYRSDKWKKKLDDPLVRGAQEYIHKHWHDVWLWQDRDVNPRAVVIQGGALDVHAKGIIH